MQTDQMSSDLSVKTDQQPIIGQKPQLPEARSKHDILRDLTPKNRLFLMLLMEGCKIPEAHRKAGYDGSEAAAYMLKHELKEEYEALLEVEGVSRSGLMAQVKRLNELDLDDSKISVKEKINLLKLLERMLPKEERSVEKPKITPIIINISDKKEISSPEVVDVEAEQL